MKPIQPPKGYATKGQCIFAALSLDMLACVYASQVQCTVMLLACIIIGIVLALGMVVLLLRAERSLAKANQTVCRLRQREEARLQKKQQVIEESVQQAEIFNTNEKLERIVPAADARFGKSSELAEKILQNIARELDIVQGLVFAWSDADQLFHIAGEYAYFSEELPRSFPLGETLSGQVAKNRELLNVKDLPEGYVTVLSGLGKSAPRHLLIAPIICGDACIGVMELAAFKPFGEKEENLVRQVCESVSEPFNQLRNNR